ncbi:MAG TPA: LPS export ABC transporter periplasmic protein LptC [Porphyromonadaceae bacterium]|jgi:LPS export ABC transporter protein LptC|nr:LPS export ABC transporter periplasmic protein LptC [Porphyromonadaceae bacterium]HBK31150.1 LPS export ABC transporter periplasmic protein LptC [Porphyromonadaceae bacterium]HBL33401.1 LPS export ABC transporter periplasmic protein LptC [Porphyromonadaceae bacterium]HBX45115.1 LPS export ABC transporter periplasmic protein LptC [Porphyromonadaceae bacterium]HCM19368.1 LPS export ABC transporter periplasmic protein LptC [Porphyromonadaceae bacterium]
MSMIWVTSCKKKDENLMAFEYDPEQVPSMTTDTVTTLISDSGVTRYKVIAAVWQVFDKAKEPYWFFPEGIYLEQFDSTFNIEATVKADTAWNYTSQNLWRLKGNVHVENIKGERFDSDELFWDQRKERVYSDKYIEITQGLRKVKAYGFESNQEMTEYRIFRPFDGIIPVQEDLEPADSLASEELIQPETTQ